MVSGKATLSSIDQTVTQARQRIAALEAQIESVSQRLLEFGKAQAQDYRALARVRMRLLADPAIVEHLDQTERQVRALLGQRVAALADLESRIQAAETARQTLEGERTERSAGVDAAAESVDAAEARTQARLDADPDYQAQRDKTRAAERKAMHAADKAKRSADELEQKGAAYHEDPLFTYLWGRGFGLPQYKAGGIIRMLDGWVARLIGFADARANYSRLNEIPGRLKEHADGLQSAAEAELEALRALDQAAREADGIPALEQTQAEEQAALDTVDQRIAGAESAHRELLAQKARFATGEDEHSARAVELLAAELGRDDLMELRREALSTPLPEDDLIVNRMLQREDERRRLDSGTEGLKDSIRAQQRRLQELEDLRIDFKRQHYDRAGSTFGDNALIAMMLTQFLDGMLDRQNLWRILREQQRYRPQRSDPTFGSGGFGRGTPWGGGIGDLGDIFGRGGNIGGGGFGGGGGGGFRTGGGF